VKPVVELRLPASPENVAVVRHALTGIGPVLGIGDSTLDTMRLAVTEACTNVVRHAYAGEGEPGPLEVRAHVDDDRLSIDVRDRGAGMSPRASGSSLGIGLSLIAALTDELCITKRSQGTLVSMSFRRHDRGAGDQAAP
jgi:anti-sigma regulatory factor (Ser/Thr protein kinase)